jgi:hypothetical protein
MVKINIAFLMAKDLVNRKGYDFFSGGERNRGKT